jgi:hypothetical protein
MSPIRSAAGLLALVAVIAFFGADQPATAQAGALPLTIGNVTRVETADGVRIAKATNAPVSAPGGEVVATASLTSVEAHPALQFRPTWIRISSGSTTVFGGTLESADGRFRKSAGYELTSGATRPGAFWDLLALPAGAAEYVLSLRRHSTSATRRG